MELSALRCFTVLARELHFARAAAILGITQPPLSRTIRRLEEELHVRLFDRSNKWKVTLTTAGQVLLPEAEALLNRAENAGELVRAAAMGECGRLTVGAISSMIGNSAFIRTLAEMQKNFPKAVTEIVDSTSGELIAMLHERKTDLALMRLTPDFSDPDLEYSKLYDDRIIAVFPAKHRLASKKNLSVKDLRQESFILVPGKVSSVFRNCVRNFCLSRGGFEPRISQEVSNTYTALRLTAAGAGITMVSSVYEGMFPELLRYRNFSGDVPSLPMMAVYPEGGPSPLAKRFLHLLKHQLGKQ